MLLRSVFVSLISFGGLFQVIAKNGPSKECGIKGSDNQHPWLVGIEYEPNYEPIPRVKCTGALIDNQHVLSTSFCFNEEVMRGVAKKVRLGPYNAITGDNCFGDINNNNCTDIGAIRIPIETITIHHKYNGTAAFLFPAATQYDIALVRLRYKVTYTETIRAICLPKADIRLLTSTDRELYITGLKFDNYNPSRKEVYYEATSYVEKTECEKMVPIVVAEDDICAKGTTFCLITGGLLVNKRGGSYELVGMLKMRTSCGTAMEFSNLYLHLSWCRGEIEKWKRGCGKRKIQHVNLIVNGDDTKAGDWPWHAAIYRTNNYICGGTLISKTMILTAAHCLVDQEPISHKIVKVVLGKYYLIGEGTGTQEKNVTSVIVHERYAQEKHSKDDIALLQLETDAIYNDYVQPACIWSNEARDRLSNNSVIGTAIGWGIDQSEILATHLKKMDMPIVDVVTCVMKKPLFYSKVLANYKKFCAGWANGTSTCNGDSGGGFFIYVPDKVKTDPSDASGSWYIRGITSLSAVIRNRGVCDPYQYTVFTDVEKYTDWIHRHLIN